MFTWSTFYLLECNAHTWFSRDYLYSNNCQFILIILFCFLRHMLVVLASLTKVNRGRLRGQPASPSQMLRQAPTTAHQFIFLLLVWVFCLPVCIPLACLFPWKQSQKRMSDLMELELQAVVSCQVCAGNQTWVLSKSSQC